VYSGFATRNRAFNLYLSLRFMRIEIGSKNLVGWFRAGLTSSQEENQMVNFENLENMDVAAESAKRELDALWNNMNEEQKLGAKAIYNWIEGHYMAAGYKRLCKDLREFFLWTHTGNGPASATCKPLP